MRTAILALSILLISSSAFGAEAKKVVPSVKVTKTVKVAKDVPTSQPASQPTVNEIVDGAKDVMAKAKELSAAKTGRLLILFALLAAVFKLLLSVVKVINPWFGSDKGKKALRITTLVLGLGTYLVTNLAMKMPWYEAIWLACSGPGALMIHELSMLIPWFSSMKAARDAKQVAAVTPEVK